MHLARALNVAGPVTVQPQYNLLVREIEWEIVTSTILGARTVEPLEDDLAAGDLHLDDTQTAALNKASLPVVHDYRLRRTRRRPTRPEPRRQWLT